MTEIFNSITFILIIITLVLFSLEYTFSGVCFLAITIYYIKINQLFYSRLSRKKKLVNDLFIR